MYSSHPRPPGNGEIRVATIQEIEPRLLPATVTSWHAMNESCHSCLFRTASMKSASWPLMLSHVEGILTKPVWKAMTSIPQSPINVVVLSTQPARKAARTAQGQGFAAAPADDSTSTTDLDATPTTKWLITSTWPRLPGAAADRNPMLDPARTAATRWMPRSGSGPPAGPKTWVTLMTSEPNNMCTATFFKAPHTHHSQKPISLPRKRISLARRAMDRAMSFGSMRKHGRDNTVGTRGRTNTG